MPAQENTQRLADSTAQVFSGYPVTTVLPALISLQFTRTMRLFHWCHLTLSISIFAAGCNLICDSVCAAEAVIKEPITDPEEFGRGVRTTEARSPQSELEGFHVPAGVGVGLVASEPLIAKPLNMAFDWKGRLWITQTYEYPYQYDAAKDTQGIGPRDAIVILEDEDGDGYREKKTVFADKLNIPIGILPYKDGVICFNIPNIMFLRDTDGDSVFDSREVLVGPFDTTRDTHGMINSLRWCPDGWIMANHGFNNQSSISGKDGKKVQLSSGNVFRFRPDGSAVELYAQGQVNPFGMTIDEYSAVFSADCHSKPISQVLQGGCYQSFGRPHDGLGFIPDIMTHLHGSTAISGLEICRGSSLPAEFQTQFVSGNVMTSRLNRNQIKRDGLTVTAVEQPDLLTSDDPWFRPVDVRLGPDGDIYVADFYNRIIGHYEVPLTHDGRDRFRGRIWKIGSAGTQAKSSMNLNDAKGCASALESSNPTVVRLALQRLEELASKSQLNGIEIKANASDSPSAIVAKAWAQQWTNPKGSADNWLAVAKNANDQVSANGFQMLSLEPSKGSSDAQRSKVLQAAREAIASSKTRPHATLEAAKILSVIGKSEDAKQILDLVVETKKSDPMLYAALRISLRELLKHDDVRNELVQGWNSSGDCGGNEATANAVPATVAIDGPQGKELFEILIALPADKFPTEAGLAYLGRSGDKAELPQDVLTSIATAFPAKDSAKLICFLDKIYGDRKSEHLRQLTYVTKLWRDQGKITKEVKEAVAAFIETWKAQSVAQSTQKDGDVLVSWFGYEGSGQNKTSPWAIEQRTRQLPDGAQDKISVFSSFPLTEQYVGKFLSAPITAKDTLSFYICGHNGMPDQPDSHSNQIQLVDANTQEVLLTAFPPRSDTAQRVEWDLKPFTGRSVQIRMIDGDTGGSFAWMAVGGFEPNGLSPNARRQEINQVLELLDMINGLPSDKSDESFRLASADEYFQLRWQLAAKHPTNLDTALEAWLFEQHKFQFANEILSAKQDDTTLPLLQRIASQCDATSQRSLVELLASQPMWHELLLKSVKQGWISSQALGVLPKTWWQANAEKPNIPDLSALRPNESDEMKLKLEKFVTLRESVGQATGSSTAGKAIFAQQCGICHQFAGQGKVVGPQLEGVGGRGLARLCEDVLLPNQNVDHAFHSAAILTTDGDVISGLVRQRTDDRIVVVDVKGQERTVNVADIESEKSSGNSLMPENFGEILSVQQLADLIQYLRKPSEAQ